MLVKLRRIRALSSGGLVIGLIILLILVDLIEIPPHGILAQRRPRQRYHHGYHHQHHPRRQNYYRSRRRNDTEGAIIPATTVFTIDEVSGSSSSSVGGEGASDDNHSKDEGNSTMVEAAETIGILRGFIPGFNLGGKNKGKGGGGGGLFGGGLFGGGGGKGKGLFGGGGGNTQENNNGGGGGKVVFPESPPSGGAGGNEGPGGYGIGGGNAATGQTGWSGLSDLGNEKGKEAGGSTGGSLFGGSGGSSGGGLFGGSGGGLFRNPFGGGGGSGSGKGRGPFRLLSKLNSDQPCAAGLGDLPILKRLPFLPKARFPSFIPSGVNTCTKTCGDSGGQWRRVPPTSQEKEQLSKDGNSCTYNWRDSLTGFPFLLFRCQCQAKCPPKKVRLSAGLLNARCENVSEKKSRCKCPYGQQSFKCTLSFLPVAVPLVQRTKPYYCACCKDEMMGEPLGGYGYGAQTSSTESTAQSQGGYDGGYAGSGVAASGNSETKEAPQGRPLGFETVYEHLRRF